MLVDATPPTIANDPGVRAGFLISAVLAKVLKVSAPFGLVRALLVLGAMPLYPEQRSFRRAASPEAYRRWIAAVDDNFAGNAGKSLPQSFQPPPTSRRWGVRPPDIPVAVVYSRAYGRRWEQMQRDLAEELHALTIYPTSARRHKIHMIRPDLVVQGIEDVLQHLPPSADVKPGDLRQQ